MHDDEPFLMMRQITMGEMQVSAPFCAEMQLELGALFDITNS